MKFFKILVLVVSFTHITNLFYAQSYNRTAAEDREVSYLSNLMEKYKSYSNQEKAIDDFLFEMEYDKPKTASGQYFAALMAGYFESSINQLGYQNIAANGMNNMAGTLQKAYSLTEKQIKLRTLKVFLCKQAADRGVPEAIAMIQALSGQSQMYNGYNPGNNYNQNSYQRSGRSRSAIEADITKYKKRIAECERYMQNGGIAEGMGYREIIAKYQQMINECYRELQYAQ